MTDTDTKTLLEALAALLAAILALVHEIVVVVQALRA